MNTDVNYIKLIANPEMMGLFKKILNARILSRFELAKEQTDESSLNKSLQELQALGYISEKKSSFHDFDKYYPTKQGLEIEKMVK